VEIDQKLLYVKQMRRWQDIAQKLLTSKGVLVAREKEKREREREKKERERERERERKVCDN